MSALVFICFFPFSSVFIWFIMSMMIVIVMVFAHEGLMTTSVKAARAYAIVLIYSLKVQEKNKH